jgi:hypothetical protein
MASICRHDSEEVMWGKEHRIPAGLIAVTAIALVQCLVTGGWAALFSRVFRVISANLAWTASSISVPTWLIITGVLIAAIAVCTVVSIAFRRRSRPAAGIESREFAKIFGIRWHWISCGRDIRELVASCPKCDGKVSPTSETRHGFIRLISYKCDCGAWRSQSFQCSEVDLIERVCRTIRKQSRAGVPNAPLAAKIH